MGENIGNNRPRAEGAASGSQSGTGSLGHREEEIHYNGRYIPYSGGSAGWFENSGVSKSEQGNNYTFHTAVDPAKVKQKRFERLGQEVGQRALQRQIPEGETPVAVNWGDQAIEAIMSDFSGRGIRVVMNEEPGFQRGDKVNVRVHPNEFFKTELAMIDAEVIWIQKTDLIGGRWHVGIAYAAI